MYMVGMRHYIRPWLQCLSCVMIASQVAATGDTDTAQTSTSMLRAPAHATDFVRGKTTHFPFVPGMGKSNSTVAVAAAGVGVDGPLPANF
jgi:hypothetical protein